MSKNVVSADKVNPDAEKDTKFPEDARGVMVDPLIKLDLVKPLLDTKDAEVILKPFEFITPLFEVKAPLHIIESFRV
jgi:hypothetical protein